ncbi:MAG TPA: hypothetical protein ENN84_03765, partial [Candidatus Marinimicrobia bacterium]|nr:hypothetical protein [Candidatus Neomarinimicrobiota bacterium]
MPEPYTVAVSTGLFMEMKKIQELLEKISADLVLAEISDLSQMAQLHSSFEELADASKAAGQKIIEQAASLTADLIQQIILEEVADPSATIETINATVSALQSLIRDGRDTKEISFPTELKLFETIQQSNSRGEKPKITLPANVDEQIFEEFIVSKASDIDDLENLLLSLEKGANDEDSAALKRIIHTIKGESAIIGLTEIENLCHKAEDLIEVSGINENVELLLRVKDWLSDIFNHYSGKGEYPGKPGEILRVIREKISALSTADPETEEVNLPIEDKTAKPDPLKNSEDDCTDKMIPVAGDLDNLLEDLELLTDFITESYEHLETADVHMLVLETDPSNYDSLNAVFRSFHTIKGVAGFLDLKEMSALAHEAENLLDQARKGLISFTGDVSQIGFEALDAMKRLVANLEKAMNQGIKPSSDCSVPALIQNLRLSQSAGEPENVPEAAVFKASDTKESSETDFEENEYAELTENKEISDEETAEDKSLETKLSSEPPKKPAVAAQQQSSFAIGRVRESVKVDADRLDRLVDTIGELVIAETMVSQITRSEAFANTELAKSISQLDKITRELQEMGTGLRMVPIRPIFQKMARLVRDLSIKMHKPVEFIMNGEDTELDKTVVDRISDP